MNRLKQKLKSESGASVVIALLFFLICSLVTATLLMAAVSNAGKIKSNQKVHQKYLTVSSALELICDDLTSAEYYGQYSFTRIENKQEVPDSTGTTQIVYTYDHYYVQQKGQYDCKLGAMLINELDAIFSKQIKADVEGFQKVDNVENHVTPLFNTPVTTNTTHTFTVGAAATDTMKLDKVQITMTLDKASYIINLTAKLEGDASYSMAAELTPTATSSPRAAPQSADGTYKTESMTWKLGWITKATK